MVRLISSKSADRLFAHGSLAVFLCGMVLGGSGTGSSDIGAIER